MDRTFSPLNLRPLCRRARYAFIAFMVSVAATAAVARRVNADEPALATAAQMAESRSDVWGEAAIAQAGGPSYEFFRDVLPPLRYANTDFRHYPIVLCAPRAAAKARWISNGSAINARANKKPMWREVGTPVHFLVGQPQEAFGNDPTRLDGPRYADGYLPIVTCAYRHGETAYRQEVLAPVDPAVSEYGLVFCRFRADGAPGQIAAEIRHDGKLRFVNRTVVDENGKSLVSASGDWRWNAETRQLKAELEPGAAGYLAVYTVPAAQTRLEPSETTYLSARQACQERWERLLAEGTKLDIPEQVVQNAWRALIIGNYLIADGDRMNYSAGNAYDHLYEAECGDALRSVLLFGHEKDAARMLGPLLAFQRQATRFHVAGQKLQLLAQYYWVTRDAAYLRDQQDAWGPVVELITSQRQPNGLLPADNYAGDIKQQVISLSSNANCWRGLRDLAAVLDDLGQHERARRLFDQAGEFRRAILDAVAHSEHRDTDPPFIPLMLLGDETPHDPLTATRLGSYYDLMAPYVLGSGVFGPQSERETWMIDYLRRHGGVAMGMIRSTPHQGEFDNEPGVNVLYGLRYMLTLLRRDDVPHALAGFYGHLAQAMTRDTFIGGEGSRFLHGDQLGRSFYLPPNSAANATFLLTLRYLLVQEWDLNDDGRPETLRLLYGMPPRWLKDGGTVSIADAPTALGNISLSVELKLSEREIVVRLEQPARDVDKLLVRVPRLDGWQIASARNESQRLTVAPGGEVELDPAISKQEIRITLEPDGEK